MGRHQWLPVLLVLGAWSQQIISFTVSPRTTGSVGYKYGVPGRQVGTLTYPTGLDKLLRTSAPCPAMASTALPLEPQGGAGPTGGAPVKRGLLERQIKVGKFALTPIGVWMVILNYICVAAAYPFLVVTCGLSLLFDNNRMRMVDWVVRGWAWVTMKLLGYKVKVVGAENLPPLSESVMYIPNHTSFLDILTLSGSINRPFKYISKVEILSIPLVGWAMVMAKHVPIRRASKESQLQMINTAVKRLVDGSSLVTFAEGTRSKGRLLSFKKGPFRITKEAGVRIVPVSICNLYKWMPPRALVPIGIPNDVVIKIHPPVETKDRSETDVSKEVFDAVNSGLPEEQRYLPYVPGSR